MILVAVPLHALEHSERRLMLLAPANGAMICWNTPGGSVSSKIRLVVATWARSFAGVGSSSFSPRHRRALNMANLADATESG